MATKVDGFDNKNITFVEGYVLNMYAKFQLNLSYGFSEEDF